MTAAEAGSQLMGDLRRLAPGLLLCFIVAAAAAFLAAHYGAPVMLFALLLGMAFHFLAADERCLPGIEFTASKLLRIGVALLGARVTFDQIAGLGLIPILLVPVLVMATIGFGVLLARILGRGVGFGLLTGGAVAICGASAALALAAAIPGRAERDVLFTVIAVTTLSTIAMIAYPLLYAGIGLADVEIGFLLGATIHDVAQVVGAGYAVSEGAGDIATFVKMLRVVLLPVAVLVIGFSFRAIHEDGMRPPLPGFAVAFAAILVVNSAGWLPAWAADAMAAGSRWLLIGAIAALGVKTSLRAMADLGGRHLAVIVGETIFLMLAAVGVALML